MKRSLKLSIIIPCYNEERTISTLLDLLVALELPVDREIIVIDNGSKVPVRPIIARHLCSGVVKLWRVNRNIGKGGAVKFGLARVTGDIIIIQDADLEYLPKDIPTLIAPILRHEARVVYGSRLLVRQEKMHFLHIFANKTLTRLVNFLFKQHLTDMETGYKAFNRSILKRIRLEASEFEIETEITYKLAQLGVQILEVPISYNTRLNGISKVSVGDGLETLFLLVKQRFFPDSLIASWLFNCFKRYGKRVVNRIKRGFFSWIKRERQL